LNNPHIKQYRLSKQNCFVTLQVLTTASMKMMAFWDIVPCRALMMEAVCDSETVYFNETTQHYIPEGCHLQNSFVLKTSQGK
jgi:hypothetical protein